MRALITILMVLAVSWSQTATAADTCTEAWAFRLKSAAEQEPARVDEILQPISTCDNANELFGAIGRLKRAPEGIAAEPLKSGEARKPAETPPAKPAVATSAKPQSGEVKRPVRKPPVVKPLAPATSATPNPPAEGTVSPTVQDAALTYLKAGLQKQLVELQKCGGFAQCPHAQVQAWVAKLDAYLSLIIGAGSPAQKLREAGDLIAQAAVDSPAVRMAELVARAFQQMSPAEQARFGKAAGLDSTFASSEVEKRITILLQNPQLLQRAYATHVAMFKPRSFVVGGRAVVVWLDLQGLPASSCDARLKHLLVDAVNRKKPGGLLVYQQDEGAAVKITASVVPAVPGDAQCPGVAGETCLRLDVAGKLDPHSDFQQHLDSVNSKPSAMCDQGALDELAMFAISSFAVNLAADQLSVKTAELVRQGCLEVSSKNEAAFSDFMAEHGGKRAPVGSASGGAFEIVHLQAMESKDLEGFGQELNESLRSHQDVLGQLTTNAPDKHRPRGIYLSWEQAGPRTAVSVSAIRLTSHWNARGGPADAELVVRPKAGKACRLEAGPFQRAAAEQVSIWLLRIASGKLRAPRSKQWIYAPLGLVLAGLPQLIDDDPRNNTRGTVMTVVDLALLGTSAVLVLTSINARNEFANSQRQADLNRANDRLRQAYWVGGFALAPRVLSVAW